MFIKRDWGYAKEYVEAMWKMMQEKNQRTMLSLLVKLTLLKNL